MKLLNIHLMSLPNKSGRSGKRDFAIFMRQQDILPTGTLLEFSVKLANHLGR